MWTSLSMRMVAASPDFIIVSAATEAEFIPATASPDTARHVVAARGFLDAMVAFGATHSAFLLQVLLQRHLVQVRCIFVILLASAPRVPHAPVVCASSPLTAMAREERIWAKISTNELAVAAPCVGAPTEARRLLQTLLQKQIVKAREHLCRSLPLNIYM